MGRWTKISLCLATGVCLLSLVGCTPKSNTNADSTTAATQTESVDSQADGSQAQTEASQNEPTVENAQPTTKEINVNDKYRGLKPFRNVKAPEITEVVTLSFKTTVGDMVIEVYPQAAPNAAKRFVELAKMGFYNDTPIFRVVKSPRPFVAQFGINWRPGMIENKDRNFNDDPSLFEIGPGTLAFAKAGPNTNSTQVFINYGDNSFLRENGGFSTFGQIVKGFELASQFKAVGSPDMGLDQGLLWGNGDAYLKTLGSNQPTMITEVTVVEPAK